MVRAVCWPVFFLLAGGWLLQLARAQVIVTGRVTGYDGKTLRAAQAQLVNAANELIDGATPGADGAFELRAPHPGILRLRFAGALHGQKDALIFTNSPETISVRAQLTAPEYSADLTNLRLSTSDPKSPLNNTPLARQPDGTLVANIESSLPELLLAANGLINRGPPIALPGYADYRCLTNLHCYAVVRPAGGKLRLVLDPKLLVRTTESSWIHYENPKSPVAVAGSILDDAEAFNTDRRLARQATAVKLSKALNQVPLNPPSVERLASVVLEIERERTPLVREARLFEYLLLLFLEAPADRALVRRTLDELTPASPLWALNFGNVAGTAILATGEPGKYVDYAMKIMDAQPTQALKGTAAAGIITAYATSGLISLAEPLVAKAKAEAGDQNLVKSVLAQHGTERRIRAGKPVPAFRAPSLEIVNSVYTPGALKGKVYLIDFWATWCLPCLAEFPGLTKLYEKYRDQGFEILSYSIDSKLDVVRQFRHERYPMPWLHAIDPELRELQSPAAREFEVTSIPRPVLVDAAGTILATDQECRGARLEEHLKRVLPVSPAR